ncbi:MAG: IMP dehydrogenase [Alphaproteobacteria bacterium]|nr:IMP dehydrogenase [Alphaproteobacteria bacterium]MBQ3944002.1 IMP dehydrogenase [Alphaproteobacteria bacterium]
MPIRKEITYGYKDLGILGAEISYIKSRSECNPFIENPFGEAHLPIIASPMAAVVSEKNYDEFNKNGIYAIIPRSVDYDIRVKEARNGKWVAFGKHEFEALFCDEETCRKNFSNAVLNICVDVANGHMIDLYDVCKTAKKVSSKLYNELTIMTGNIDNPKVYDWIRRLNNGYYEKYGKRDLVINYIKVGIGGGDGCTTTPQTGVHMGQASLIDECRRIYEKYDGHCCPKIIADGGIKSFGDVVKALALGAHYVMIGSLFSRTIESAGKKTINPFTPDFELPSQFIDDYTDFDYDNENDVWNAEYKGDGKRYCFDEIDVTFFGMASGNGQRAMNGEKTKVSEGTTKILKVNFTLPKWVHIMVGSLKSAMSYCNAYTISDFIGKQDLVVLSQNEINSLNT